MDDLDLRYGVDGWLKAQWESLRPQELRAVADEEMTKSAFYNAAEKYELLNLPEEALQAYLLAGEDAVIKRFAFREFKRDLDFFCGEGASFMFFEEYEPHYVGDEVDSYFGVARVSRGLGKESEAVRSAKLALKLALSNSESYAGTAIEILDFLEAPLNT